MRWMKQRPGFTIDDSELGQRGARLCRDYPLELGILWSPVGSRTERLVDPSH